VHHLCIFHNINEGQIVVGCDGYSAIQTAMETDPSLNADIPDYDLVGAIYTLRRASKIVWSFRHIKGHQDDQSTDLDVWAQRNVQMDLNAKAHLAKARLVPRHYDIPGEPWQLWVNGQKVKAAIFPTIYSHVHNRDGELYWAEKRQQELTTISHIDWTLIGKAMRSIPRSRRVFISKHVSGMCGVGKFMKRWKEWEDDRCPRCREPEDAPHVWRCKGEGTAVIWTKALEGLAVPPLAFQTLVEDQGHVGWSRFFEGWLVHQWTICQQRYYQICNSKRTGRRWTIEVIKKLCWPKTSKLITTM
jgi:hypothetical protein